MLYQTKKPFGAIIIADLSLTGSGSVVITEN